MTAAHCAKTLITASASGNPVLKQCTRLLLPGLVECLAKGAASSDDASPSEQVLATVSEIHKALSALFQSLPEDIREFIRLIKVTNVFSDCDSTLQVLELWA